MVEFFFAFLTKKGEKHKILHQNIQCTGHWPKSFGPVFISRLSHPHRGARRLTARHADPQGLGQ